MKDLKLRQIDVNKCYTGFCELYEIKIEFMNNEGDGIVKKLSVISDCTIEEFNEKLQDFTNRMQTL